jgi:hypothetical protein
MPTNNWEDRDIPIIMQFCIWLDAWWNIVYPWRCVLTSFYYDVTIESKFAADETIFNYYPIYYINWYYIFFTVFPTDYQDFLQCWNSLSHDLLLPDHARSRDVTVLLSGDVRATSTDYGTFRYTSLWRWLMWLRTYVLWCDNFNINFVFLGFTSGLQTAVKTLFF